MSLSKRIPVTEQVWKELAEMKKAGQTYNDLLAEMIELRKKRRLVEDVSRSLLEDDFVPLSEIQL
jgi:predicted CopG family antitoxin